MERSLVDVLFTPAPGRPEVNERDVFQPFRPFAEQL